MKRLLIAILMGTTLLCAGQGTSPAERQLQSAINKEVVQCDLKVAIEQYKKIISTYKDNRAVAAKALVHMGACYEKLGESEAEKYFRQVVDNYSDQAEAVSTAKDRLVVIARSKTGNAPGNIGIVLRQVSVPEGQVSPDGKFIIDKYGLVIHEMATGKKMPLYDPKSCPVDCMILSDSQVWAPDAIRLAFIRSMLGNMDELCTENKDGTNFGIVLKKKAPNYLAGWTGDGKSIILLDESSKPNAWVKVAVPTGTMQIIKTFENNIIPFEARISPNSRYLAYEYYIRHSDRPVSADTNDTDISMISIDGTQGSQVVKHPSSDRLLGWSSDSQYVLFSSNRGGTEAIWAQLMKDGKSEGEPRLIRMFSGELKGLGHTVDGGGFISESTGGSDVFTAQIDLQTGKVLKAPERVEPLFQGGTTVPFWSPDGDSLGYFIRTSPGIGGRGRFQQLRIHSIRTRVNRDFALDVPPSDFSPAQSPNWAPDGDNIIFRDARDVSRLNLTTGKAQNLSSGQTGSSSAWSQDGKLVYGIKYNGPLSPISGRQGSIIRKNLVTMEESQIFAGQIGQSFFNLSLSPDGRWLGFVILENKESAFYAIPSVGGTARKLMTGGTGNIIFWGPNGKGALFERIDSTRKTSSLVYLPSFDSPETITIPLEMPRIRQLSFHPDGKTIAFNTIEPAETKIWVLGNFLPAKK